MNYLVAEAESPNDMYKDSLEGIIKKGKDVSHRGMETKEIRPVMLIFEKPQQRFLTCPGRKINPFFQIMESIWILGGRGDVKWISKYLKNIEKYSDGEDVFHAPYGMRMRHVGNHRSMRYNNYGHGDQFKHCYEYLKKDPNTRHAVMTFWDSVLDHYLVQTIDRPCNIGFHFLIRDGKLDLTIFNRSNDVHLGLMNANVVQFSVILETMAMLLGIPVGRQIHMINSLHYYTDSPLTDNILSADYEFNMYNYVKPMNFNIHHSSLDLLDEELKIFFDAEERIWKGEETSNVMLSFSFLKEALILAQVFYFFKNYDSYWALRNMYQNIKSDDIYITCVEYLARSFDYDLILNNVNDRFGNLPNDHLMSIRKYIFTH